MKKIFVILLSLAIVFSLAACNSSEEKPTGGEEGQEQAQNQVQNQDESQDEQQQQEEEIPAESTKTFAFFQKFLSDGEYTMEMKTTSEGIEMTMKSAYKDDMIYSESEYGGQKNIMVMKDGYQYIIDHGAKTVMKMQIVNNSAVTDMFADEAANYEKAVATGETEYNGKSYEYEEFTLEGETAQYLFDGDALKIIKASAMGVESVVEILSLEKGADANLFEIPANYQTVSY